MVELAGSVIRLPIFLKLPVYGLLDAERPRDHQRSASG